MKRPTLADQVRQAGAPAGSALGKTIREKQNFELLQSAEFEDDCPIPLWLTG